MAKSRFSDEKLDELAQTHVAYEATMLIRQALKFCECNPDGKPPKDGFEEAADDALLEAILVHLRLLDDFLVGRDKRDIHASDWIASWTTSGPLPGAVRRRINRQVAHLSPNRVLRFDWDIRAYGYACCMELDRFLDELKDENVPRYAAFAHTHKSIQDGLRALAPSP